MEKEVLERANMVELLRPQPFAEKITYKELVEAQAAWRTTQLFPRVCRAGMGAPCRRAQPSASAWRAASRTPRKQIKAHVTQSNGTPTSVLLPGKSHRQRSLVGYSPWGC